MSSNGGWRQKAKALVDMPDAQRQREVTQAETDTLSIALEIAMTRGAAYAASHIAYELGYRRARGES